MSCRINSTSEINKTTFAGIFLHNLVVISITKL